MDHMYRLELRSLKKALLDETALRLAKRYIQNSIKANLEDTVFPLVSSQLLDEMKNLRDKASSPILCDLVNLPELLYILWGLDDAGCLNNIGKEILHFYAGHIQHNFTLILEELGWDIIPDE